MKRIARSLIRLYPRQWRVRYGREFAALLEDAELTWRDLADMIAGALCIRQGEYYVMDHPAGSPRILDFKDRDIPHGFEMESAIEYTRGDGQPAIVRQFYREIDLGDSYVMISHSARDSEPAQTIVVSGVKGEVSGDFRSDRTEMLVLNPDGSVRHTQQTVNTWLKQEVFREKARAIYHSGLEAGLSLDQIFKKWTENPGLPAS
jgi:hypothetical protein